MLFLQYLKRRVPEPAKKEVHELFCFFPRKWQFTRRVFLDSQVVNVTPVLFSSSIFYSSWSSLSSSKKVMLVIAEFSVGLLWVVFGVVYFFLGGGCLVGVFFTKGDGRHNVRLSSNMLHFGGSCCLLLPSVTEELGVYSRSKIWTEY